MKKILILALTLISINKPLVIDNDLTKENLKGKVKQVKYYFTKNPTKCSEIVNYNKKGFIISTTSFTYKKNEQTEKRTALRTYLYTKKGLKKMTSIDSVSINDWTKYEENYDEDGNIINTIESFNYFDDGIHTYRGISTIEYNKKRNEIITYHHGYRHDSIDSIENLLWSTKEYYNTNKRIISYELYDSNLPMLKRLYNNKGLDSITIDYGKSIKDTLNITTTKYDSFKNKIETENIEFLKNSNKKVIKYNRFYKYIYDKHNNWISYNYKDSINGKLKESKIFNREIIYY